jgi:hypothetical protein
MCSHPKRRHLQNELITGILDLSSCPRQMTGAHVYIGKVQIRIGPIKIGKKIDEGPIGSSFFTQNQVPQG